MRRNENNGTFDLIQGPDGIEVEEPQRIDSPVAAVPQDPLNFVKTVGVGKMPPVVTAKPHDLAEDGKPIGNRLSLHTVLFSSIAAARQLNY